MSFVVVVFVALLAFFYVSSTRRARQMWLKKLDLLGRWHWQEGDCALVLTGQRDGGEFQEHRDGEVLRGRWRIQGHFMYLVYVAEDTKAVTAEQRFDLHFFKPGNIGLENDSGERRVYVKETSNVVSLNKH